MSTFKRFTTVVAVATVAAMALTACGEDSTGPSSDFDPNAPVTLNLAFWGNDTRAGMYEDSIEEFNKEYPNITVNYTFLGFPEFWEKRQIEAAGGGLPDVMQFDYSYLRQYSENGLLLDLGPYLGDYIKTDAFNASSLSIGVVDGVTTALPIGTNAWGLFANTALLGQVGVDAYAGGTSWQEYGDWIAQVTQAGGGSVWGGTDMTARIQDFELYLRANGKNLFTDDGKVAFTRDELKAFWELGSDQRSGAAIPQSRLEEVKPKSGFGAGLTASELTWDNFGAGFLGDLGATDPGTLAIIAPPTAKAGSKDLYLKPSMLHAIAATTQHPEASALLVNFLLNSEKAGAIFGTNRALPASATQLAGVELDPLSQAVLDYETSIAARLGAAPPVPVVGYGSIEEKFRLLGEELGLGTVTIDEAVSQFFDEVDVILNQ